MPELYGAVVEWSKSSGMFVLDERRAWRALDQLDLVGGGTIDKA